MTEAETGATSERVARGRNAARVRAAKGRRRLMINIAIAVIVLAVIAFVVIRRVNRPNGARVW